MDFVSAKVGTYQLLKITEVIPQNYYNIFTPVCRLRTGIFI